MLHIKMNEKATRLHKIYFKNNIKPKFEHYEDVIGDVCIDLKKNKANINMTPNIEELICRMCLFFQEKWEELAIGDVDKLKKLRTEWEASFVVPSLYEKFIQHALIKLFGYDNFSRKTISIKERTKVHSFDDSVKWSPYTFVYWLGLRVCPYCNRQYITPIITKKKRMRADLDHFWPKNKYPLFSMSLYNMVPSCKFCNSSLKHEEDPGINAPHPYYDDYDDYFTFGVDSRNLDRPQIKINRSDNKIKELLEMFCIEEQYKYHSNIARDFFVKRQLYQPELVRAMMKDGSYDEKTLLSIIVGYPIDRENISEDVLGKLRRDLAVFLKFVS